MSSLNITSRSHPARRARRVVGVTSLATTVGIVGGITATQRSSSAEDLISPDDEQSTLSKLTQTSTTVLPTTGATPVPTSTTTATTTTTTTTSQPADNPFAETGALSGLDDIVTPTTTTTTAPRPVKKAPPATNNPPPPPTTVSNGS